jgi:hypothetical protein
MNNWKILSKTETVDFYRGGWRGVWDALVAVIKREPRKSTPTQVTCSVWVNAPEGQEVELQIRHGKMGIKNDIKESFGGRV